MVPAASVVGGVLGIERPRIGEWERERERIRKRIREWIGKRIGKRIGERIGEWVGEWVGERVGGDAHVLEPGRALLQYHVRGGPGVGRVQPLLGESVPGARSRDGDRAVWMLLGALSGSAAARMV